ncbi:MAG TPA: hypothetical protein VK983_04500 [Candidatus Limnocylindrales bacterium]|nr:hypothetical protein [Candidatus Limnocylindrales bacterium]
MNSDSIDAFLSACTDRLASLKEGDDFYDSIVNIPFESRLEATLLGLGIVVLLLKNDKDGTVDRVALSRTERAEGAVAISVKKFEEIKIPLDEHDNVLVQAIHRDEFRIITDWKYLFIPALTPQEARLNQAGAAIDCSVVYPLSQFSRGGALIFSYFEPMSKLTNGHHRFMGGYAKAASEALERFARQ